LRVFSTFLACFHISTGSALFCVLLVCFWLFYALVIILLLWVFGLCFWAWFSHLKNNYNVVGLGRKKKKRKKDRNTDKQSISACFDDC